MNPDLVELVVKVRLLALDSDGVLTDGGVYVDDRGLEFRRFDIKDGLGLKRVMEAGIHVAIISGSDAKPVLHRARNLGIDEVHVGVTDKLRCLQGICERVGVMLDEVAYIGDDLPDLAIMDHVGLACAPADAHELVIAKARIITRSRGGQGAVRELCEIIYSDQP